MKNFYDIDFSSLEEMFKDRDALHGNDFEKWRQVKPSQNSLWRFSIILNFRKPP